MYHPGPTRREIEVVKLLASGKTAKEIATIFYLSHRTVEVHRTNAMRKLGVHSAGALLAVALGSGYITMDDLPKAPSHAPALDTSEQRSHTDAMAKTNRKPAGGSSLPAVADFLETLDQTTEQCGIVLAVKSRAVKIPANIRTQMRGLTRLAAYWAKNKTTYAALIEAVNERAERATA